MVSGEKAWDPHHAGRFQPHLSGKHRAPGRSPLHDSPCVVAKGAALHRSRRLPPLSSPPPPGAPSTFRPSFSSSEFHPASLYSRSQTEGLHKPARCPSVVSQSEEEAERRDMKGKRLGCRADATPEDKLDDMGDGAKNAKITLSFPLNAAPLPTSLTSPNHCHGSSSASPSPHHRRLSAKGADKASLWKLDATTDVKHRPFKPPRRDGSPSSSPSSSSSPMSVPAFMRKDLKSPPPLKCSKLNAEAQIHRSPPRSSSGPLGGCFGGDGWGDRYNGTASPSQTAQILFSLGTSAYQRGGEAERREKLTGRPAGKAGSPHGPSLHPPTLHFPPPLPPPPPLPSEGLTAPPHSSSYPPTDSLKPELICGVCHRLFSSASSLTVHMRLHRGSRALSCRYCGKVFIHSKRLQSHETSCRLPGLSSGSLRPPPPPPPALPPHPVPPPLAVQPKEEPLEEGEVRVEGGVIVGQTDIIKARPGKKARSLLARLQGDDAAGELLAGDENHFVKVVDGNIIYFCSVCERSYMTLSSLKRHSNVHSWRRKYPCHYCDKVFALAEYRTKHEVWHTGERRYQCIFCWDAFATYYNLKTHQKTIHGINPSLISSEKTANGGYKQKANALKLYRLLPMRSQKRPYKTYSDSLHNGLLLPPADAPSLSLPGLGCALAPEDLQSLIVGAPPQSVKPDPDAFPDEFPVSITAEHGDLSALTPLPRTDAAQVRKLESDTSESEQDRGGFKMSNRSKTKTLKTGRGAETSMPSVITYGHTKPSVIVHGAAVSSSVIVHSNQVSSGSNKSPVNSPSPETSSSQTLIKGSPRPIKKRRDSADNHRKRSKDGADTTEEGSRGRQDAETGRLFHKSRKFHSKSNVPASKQASAPAGSQGKEAGPLCQITVRIGEEAIVKRSISETDLRRDKSLSPPKIKRSETSSARDAHAHHHHHKHRPQSRVAAETEAGEEAGDREEEEEDEEEDEQEEESRRNGSKSPDQVREYYFRRGVREQDSDNDMEDNLWRPYYSYKPKRKAQAHLQRVKSWQQKLKYKRSIRLKRRTERLKRLLNKQTDKSQDEEDDGTAEEAEKLSKPHKAAEEGKETDDCSPPPKEKETDAEERVEEARRQVPSSPVPSPKPPPSTSAAPAGVRRRPWTNGNAAECGTCGRWFSSPRKRDKHELSHLLEFVCLFCRATFPSRDKLEDHQRVQHPKPAEAAPAPSMCGESVVGAGGRPAPEVAAKYDEDRGAQVGSAGSSSSPSRVSRRALSRHTCLQCHKVCKTSSALNRHVRRHELSSSPEREKEELSSEPQPPPQTFINALCTDSEADKGQTPSALSVSVISYSAPDPAGGGQPEDRLSEVTDKRLKSDSSEKPELRLPESNSRPHAADGPLQRPVSLTPSKPELAPATPSPLQSVLVMNGPDCLDYRTPGRRSLDGQAYRTPSPLHYANSPSAPATSQARIIAAAAAAPPVSMATPPVSEGGFARRDGVIIDRERQAGSGTVLRASYEESPLVQDLRLQPLSRSPSPDEAQDLTMSSILAREREVERQRERERNKETEKEIERTQKICRASHPAQDQTALLVPKEEPLSPAPSPQHVPPQTTMNGPPSHRHTPKSPCRSPPTTGRPLHSSSQGLDRLTLPTGAAGAGERPSAHALLLPRAPEPDRPDAASSRDSQPGDANPAGYPAQDYPLPLTVPDGYRSAKKQEENLLMSSTYPPRALPFGPLGKVIVPNGGDLAKLPFYPDPYQLLYGPQLLAYPYNLAALPVALNMMAPGGDKVEPLPFLPAIFNYAATAGPYMGAVPPPLVANPGLYGSGSSVGGKKHRDGGGGGKQ
ncbi:zinc finger and BTB domain-containing protein 4 isoform X2 [Kryptolebias marmoratus]|nr:zinc finger and BTB domain-containing protein 4 isoform X2 [Kryptolebias marmoratus]